LSSHIRPPFDRMAQHFDLTPYKLSNWGRLYVGPTVLSTEI